MTYHHVLRIVCANSKLFRDGLPGLRFTWSYHQRHPNRWQPVLSKRTKQRRSDTYRNQDWVNTIIVTTHVQVMNILYHTVMLTLTSFLTNLRAEFPGSPNNLGCSTRLDDAVQCCAQRIWKWECENCETERYWTLVNSLNRLKQPVEGHAKYWKVMVSSRLSLCSSSVVLL